MSTSYLQRQKREKTRQFNFLSQWNSQTYTTNKTTYMYIHAAFKRLTSHKPFCIVYWLQSIYKPKEMVLFMQTDIYIFVCLFVLLNPFCLSNQSVLREVMHNPNTWGREQVRNLIAAGTHTKEPFFFPLLLCTRQTGCIFDLAVMTKCNLTMQHG